MRPTADFPTLGAMAPQSDDPVTNADVARALREMSLLLAMKGTPFKPAAYDMAAGEVADMPRPIAEAVGDGGAAGLAKLPGIGKGIATRIVEMVQTGRIDDLEQLRHEVPVDVLGLTSIEGVGPKRVKALYDALGIRDIASLEKACRDGKVRELSGFGKRSEERILEAIGLKTSGRRPIAEVASLAKRIAKRLEALPGVQHAVVAGSFRRGKATIGDIDILVTTTDPEGAADAFVSSPEVVHVHSRGDTKTMVRLNNGMDADLRVVPERSFGAALMYFTGSKAHNVALRKIAISRGLKLNEYGLFRDDECVAARTEEDIYEALGLDFIPPTQREHAPA